MPPFAAQHSLFRAYDIRGPQQYFISEFVQALGDAFARLYNSQSQPVKGHCSLKSNRLVADSCAVKAFSLKARHIKNSHTRNSTTRSNATKNSNAAHNNELAHILATVNESRANTVVIGYDVRRGSDTIAQILADTFRQHGLLVVDLGLITTPMMAFWAEQYDGHGVMVTASHSAKDTLGIKWLVDNASSSSEDIQALYQQLGSTHNPTGDHPQKKSKSPNKIKSQYINNPTKQYNSQESQDKNLNTNAISNHGNNSLNLSTEQVARIYINAIAQVFTRIDQRHDAPAVDHCQPISKFDLTIVIDCMNGATSNIAQRLFEQFCQRVIMLNDTPDGNFPTGNPDPTEPNRLAELQQTVMVTEADIGLAFDGDGDRLMIVDNSGKVVTPDHLLYLLAQVALNERPESLTDSAPTAQVLFDVKCSHHLPKLLIQLGAIPVITRTGSSLMRRQLQSSDSHFIFAGELSGHFVFNDGYFIVYDDAMYAGLRLLHWLVHTATLPNNALPIPNDSWGELRPAMTPYRLTDITQYLPMMCSTADHYLPLPDTVLTECSIVQQLNAFCHYLQYIVEGPSASARCDKTGATSCAPALCACVASRLQLTLAQAEQLLPAGTQLTCIDGIRLDFAHGFGVLRQSNTSNNLTVRLAGDSVADLKNVQKRFVALCRPFDKKLSEQIAAIYSE